MEPHNSLLRLYAFLTKKSVLTRATAAVTRQLPVLGIVLIRTAGDHGIQAIAVGRLDALPSVTVLRDPFRPGPLDYQLVDSRMSALLAQGPWQIWIPDEATLRALGLEGKRNWRNPAVPPHRRSFARLCYAIYRLSQRPGQQIVVVATDLLPRHLTTGQSPTEDAHLGARLAWDNPEPHEHPCRVAESRRLWGSLTLLPYEDDEEIEAIRAQALRGSATLNDLWRGDDLLEDAALERWQILQEAHQVYQYLDVPDLAGLAGLAQQSWKDFMWLVTVNPAFGVTEKSTLHEFQKRQHLYEVYEDLNARGDPVVRECMRQEGRVIGATLLRVTPAAKKRSGDCWLLLRTTQVVRRFRVGTLLKTQDNAVTGRVEGIRNTAGAVLFQVRVTRGVTAARALPLGSRLDWFDTVVFNSGTWMQGGRRGKR